MQQGSSLRLQFLLFQSINAVSPRVLDGIPMQRATFSGVPLHQTSFCVIFGHEKLSSIAVFQILQENKILLMTKYEAICLHLYSHSLILFASFKSDVLFVPRKVGGCSLGVMPTKWVHSTRTLPPPCISAIYYRYDMKYLPTPPSPPHSSKLSIRNLNNSFICIICESTNTEAKTRTLRSLAVAKIQ